MKHKTKCPHCEKCFEEELNLGSLKIELYKEEVKASAKLKPFEIANRITALQELLREGFK